jgi:hypothetical protein
MDSPTCLDEQSTQLTAIGAQTNYKRDSEKDALQRFYNLS